MKALTWHGKRDVRVDDGPGPRIQEPTDAIVRVTSTAICGSDLHLYEVLGPFLTPGDILGHEPMGIVEEVGSEVTDLQVGDRVVIPFNISCGTAGCATRGLFAQCETTQVREYGKGAALFGYTKLYGAGARAGRPSSCGSRRPSSGRSRSPRAARRALRLPLRRPAHRLAGRRVRRRARRAGRSRCSASDRSGRWPRRIALHRGRERVIGVDLVPERLALAATSRRRDRSTSTPTTTSPAAMRELTDGRGPDAVDRRGRHGGARRRRSAKLRPDAVGLLPDAVARPMTDTAAVDRLARAAWPRSKSVRRGGTVSLSGVYGGEVDPLPMMQIFDKRHPVRMGQANVRRWIDDILPLAGRDDDPLGVDDLATHHLPLEEAPDAPTRCSRRRHDGAIKVVLKP